jgi:hypothetical protein
MCALSSATRKPVQILPVSARDEILAGLSAAGPHGCEGARIGCICAVGGPAGFQSALTVVRDCEKTGPNRLEEFAVIPDEDELLVMGLGRLGGPGAAWTARRLRKDVYELEKTLASPLDEVFAHVAGLLGSIGRVVAQTGSGDREALVCGVVGSGAMNLNPAVITVTITSPSHGITIVHIRGAAKEGLIKQRAGEKAAKRLESLLG